MADVDLRKLRYFVAVAERLHFGRAAEALHIAQPVLSRQIRALEDELKARLFVRDRRATELTPAGRQLLTDARPLLASAEALRQRVARTARGQGSFAIGFMPGLIVTGAIRALLDRYPQLDVTVVSTNYGDQTEVIGDGRADVSYLRLPADLRGLQVRELLAEPRVAALPAGHRLAGKDAVSITDLADEHLLQDPDTVPQWRDIATEMRSRGRRGAPVFRTVEEKLEHVAAGQGFVLLPVSAQDGTSRRRAHARAAEDGCGRARHAARAVRSSDPRPSPPGRRPYGGARALSGPSWRRLARVRMDKFTIVVDDYDRAITFFTDALGFELAEDSPALTNDGRAKRWVVVRPPGGGTGILLAQADGERQAGAIGNQIGGRVGFFLTVDDFDAAYQRMTAAGVEFATVPRTEPYGQVAVFVDIAGNRWDLLGPTPT